MGFDSSSWRPTWLTAVWMVLSRAGFLRQEDPEQGGGRAGALLSVIKSYRPPCVLVWGQGRRGEALACILPQ